MGQFGAALGPKRMELAGQIIEVKGDPMWLMGCRRSLDHSRVERESAQEVELFRRRQPFERGLRKVVPSRAILTGEIGHDLARSAEDRVAARVTVLHIEDRVVA